MYLAHPDGRRPAVHRSDARLEGCPHGRRPGKTVTIRIPIWNERTLDTLQDGAPVACRCTLLDPNGRRTIMADIIIVPEQAKATAEAAMPIGPDAE